MLWRASSLLVVLLLLCDATEAKDAVSRRQLWERFQAARTHDDRRAVLAELGRWSLKERERTLLVWSRRAAGEPARVAILARALADTAGEHVDARLLSLLKDARLAAAQRGLLRVLADSRGRVELGEASFGPAALWDPAAALLAAWIGPEAKRLAYEDGATSYLRLNAVGELLSDPPEAPWVRVGLELERLPALSRPLARLLVRRTLDALPPPTPEGLRGWPRTYLGLLADEGVEAAAAAQILEPDARSIVEHLDRVLRRRRPDSVFLLVDALVEAEPHSATFYRLHAALLDLTGSRVPPDPDQWRSWAAGHRDRIQALDRMPPTASVEAAVARGVAFLLSRQLRGGGFRYQPGVKAKGEADVGATALVLYALSKSGVPSDAAPMKRAATFMLRNAGGRRGRPALTYNYAASIAVMALQSLGRAWKTDLAEVAGALVGGQMRSGGWTYYLPRGTTAVRKGKIDLSNTQYAILGLRAASFAQAPVERDVWEGALRLMRGAEVGTSGEWLYYVPSNRTRPGMAAIAAASMLIAMSQLDRDLELDDVLADEQIERALRSMARKYGWKRRYAELDLYTLYSVERVGALFGVYSFDGVPWYEEGLDALLARQLADGGWGLASGAVDWLGTWGRNVDTAYALLFLKRATTPVFNAGLDVPSNPDLPIRRVPPQPAREPRVPVAVSDPAVDEAPAPVPSHPAVVARRERLREDLVDACAEAGSPADALVAWRLLAALDPLDARAHVMAGQALSPAGAWVADSTLEAALPAAPPSEVATQDLAQLLDRVAKRALDDGRARRGIPLGRALVGFALDVKRVARALPDAARR